MLVCPVCKYHHQEEVSKCRRCSWSMQDDLEISSEHPILTTCIPTLVESLTNKVAQYEKLSSILQGIDLQESKRKLDEIQEEFVALNKTINNNIIDKLEFLVDKQSTNIILEDKNAISSLENDALPTNHIESQNIAIEDNSDSPNYNYNEPKKTVSLPNFSNNNSNNNLQFVESDRHTNREFNSTDESSEDSLYYPSENRNINDGFGHISEPEQDIFDNSPSHLEDYKITNYSENNQLETNSHDSYDNFYRLIERQEIEVTRVTVTKETMQKMRGGTLSKLEFSNDRRGNYLIINSQGAYCLIPKENLNINPYQYGNFQRVFNCQDYQETYQDFEVIESAKVVSCDREIWQLEKKGEIKFI